MATALSAGSPFKAAARLSAADTAFASAVSTAVESVAALSVATVARIARNLLSIAVR